MVDMLRRTIAPLTDDAWHELDTRASRVLKTLLTARTLVDFQGPHGWQLGAVNLGRLEVSSEPGPQLVPWGVRRMLPLVELRIPFTLTQIELDNIARGSRDADLAPMEVAARRIALFEEEAIYRGFPEGQIAGILPCSRHEPIPLPAQGEHFPAAVARAYEVLNLAGSPGPYALVLGQEAFCHLMQPSAPAYLPHRVIQEMLGAKILMSPVLPGGVLLSSASGNFELTVGQDLSIGYAVHDREHVELYFTESFTFRVLEATAAVELRPETP